MDCGAATIDQMVESTKRGLLITFFWYIRPVEQMTLLNTGPARGCNNVTMIGQPIPMHIGEAYNPGTALVPPVKIEDFRMTSISPAV